MCVCVCEVNLGSSTSIHGSVSSWIECSTEIINLWPGMAKMRFHPERTCMRQRKMRVGKMSPVNQTHLWHIWTQICTHIGYDELFDLILRFDVPWQVSHIPASLSNVQEVSFVSIRFSGSEDYKCRKAPALASASLHSLRTLGFLELQAPSAVLPPVKPHLTPSLQIGFGLLAPI